jgi:hypothetical protein
LKDLPSRAFWPIWTNCFPGILHTFSPLLSCFLDATSSLVIICLCVQTHFQYIPKKMHAGGTIWIVACLKMRKVGFTFILNEYLALI